MRNAVCILLLVIAGCQSKDQYSIQGYLPDKTYDGAYIYLVPLENAVKERVDSAIILDGKFRMEGVAKSSEIYILRPKPLLRLSLQELLVVREPGELTVSLNANSLVTGTALNDSLLKWKEKKLMDDFLIEQLKQKYKEAGKAEKAVLKRTADSIHIRMVDFHFHFVRRNKANVVGKFVHQTMGSLFSPEQKMSLNMK